MPEGDDKKKKRISPPGFVFDNASPVNPEVNNAKLAQEKAALTGEVAESPFGSSFDTEKGDVTVRGATPATEDTEIRLSSEQPLDDTVRRIEGRDLELLQNPEGEEVPLFGAVPKTGTGPARQKVDVESQFLTGQDDAQLAADQQENQRQQLEVAKEQQRLALVNAGVSEEVAGPLLRELQDLNMDAANQAVNQAFEQARTEMDEVNNQLKRLSTAQVNPNRIFANGGAFSASMAVAVGAIAQSLNPGTQNAALKIIDAAIERDMRAQEVNIQNSRNILGQRVNMLQELTDSFGDEAVAKNKMREFYYMKAQNMMTASLAGNNSQQAAAKIQQANLLNQQKQIAASQQADRDLRTIKVKGTIRATKGQAVAQALQDFGGTAQQQQQRAAAQPKPKRRRVGGINQAQLRRPVQQQAQGQQPANKVIRMGSSRRPVQIIDEGLLEHAKNDAVLSRELVKFNSEISNAETMVKDFGAFTRDLEEIERDGFNAVEMKMPLSERKQKFERIANNILRRGFGQAKESLGLGRLSDSDVDIIKKMLGTNELTKIVSTKHGLETAIQSLLDVRRNVVNRTKGIASQFGLGGLELADSTGSNQTTRNEIRARQRKQ